MLCRNNEVWPNYHTHQKAEESRRCWFPDTRVSTPPIAASRPVSVPPMPTPPAPVAVASSVRMATESQINFVRRLGGDPVHAAKLTLQECSKYIERLKAATEGRKLPVDPKLEMIKGMLDMVPDGYYAAQKDLGGHVDFIRISRPTRGKYKGSLKIQTQHSDKWAEAVIKWPSGSWSVYKDITEALMLVVSDHRTCQKRYSIEVQACGHCNTALTDDRSRHYLVGPICVEKYDLHWVIEEVDDANDGLSFEQLVARGKPTRVWQDKALAR